MSALGEKVSVKTTCIMGNSGSFAFNINTLCQVDRIIILRINTEEMQIEILLNEYLVVAEELMSTPNAQGKATIAMSKLIKKPKDRLDIPLFRCANHGQYTINELENGTIEVLDGDQLILPAKPKLREICADLNLNILNSNGKKYTTRQLGTYIIRALAS